MISQRCKFVLTLWRQPRWYSTSRADQLETITVSHKTYNADEWTNITPKIQSYMPRKVYLQPHHPLSIVRQQIINYFYKAFLNTKGNPLFSVYDNLDPVVSTQQNFDNLLIPLDHPSRKKSDCYYLNKEYLLRGHTTAHQVDLLKSGLDNFLIVGEVFRRDEIDSTHYPVFHQLDAVRTVHRDKLFANQPDLQIFESSYQAHATEQVLQNVDSKCIDQTKQPCHTLEAVKLMEHEFKTVLVGLAQHLFGKKVQYRWVDTYFPFTQPSWELEIYHGGKWLEVMGSGIMRNEILTECGIHNSIGWAFGLGLERIAMVLFNIPDIRLFWSKDSGFVSQFNDHLPLNKMRYKSISAYPQCSNDLSFWLPEGVSHDDFSENDFYDLVRSVAGDIVEQVGHINLNLIVQKYVATNKWLIY